MRIDVWSDVVCPWCYIGKRRLEKAIEGFEHGEDVEVVYHSFQLDPSTPRDTTELAIDGLAQRYGGIEKVRQMMDHVEATAAAEGLLFRLTQTPAANTIDAHRLLHLAASVGQQAELKEALLKAYFTDAENVADHTVLARVAEQVGLPTDRVTEVLAGSEYADAVEADIRQAAAFGATGVPFFVIDNKYGVSGAQPTATFGQVLAKAWEEKHPPVQLLDVAGAEDAEACGPDGCAL